MSETFAGLPISIPLRIVKTSEQPIRRTYWFTSTFTSESQSINGLLVAYLRKNSIPLRAFSIRSGLYGMAAGADATMKLRA